MADIFDQAVAEPDVFDQASQGDIFDQALKGETATEPTEQPKRPLGELASRFMASAASSTIDTAAGALRLVRKTPLGKIGDFIAESTGGVTSQEVLTELEGASSRAKEDYAVDPRFNQGFGSALASGGGQLLTMLASGPAAPVTAALQAGESGYKEAEEAGATGAKLLAATAGNAATAFVMEKLLGVPAMLKGVKEAARVPVENMRQAITSVIKEGTKGFGMEALQEASEEVIQDLIAKGLYDPDREMWNSEYFKKLGIVAVTGGLLGGGLRGTLRTGDVSRDLAPKEQVSEVNQAVEETISQVATSEPPPLVESQPATAPVISPEEMSMVPEGTPEELQSAVPVTPSEEAPVPISPEEVPAAQEARLTPHAPTQEGPHIVSTGIMTPEGVATGEGWNTKHADIIKSSDTVKMALAEGMEIDELDANKGFIVQDESGKQRFVGRKEAIEIAKQSGQVDESILYTPSELISEALIQPKKPNVQQTEETQGKAAPEVRPTQEQAATQLQPLFRQAEKTLQAEEPGAAANQALESLSKQVADGTKTIEQAKQQFMAAARNFAANQKRGLRAKMEVQPTPTEEGTTPIEQARTDIGPRAEAVAKETAEGIQAEVNKMPENDRKVMAAIMESGGSDQDIATSTGLTLDQVKKAKSRAKETLRKFIQEQGIGQRLAPGAANLREMRKAQFIAAADMYRELQNSDQLTKANWKSDMNREYEDAFTDNELEQVWNLTEEANRMFDESDGRRPIPAIMGELMGETQGTGTTSIKNATKTTERALRGLPPSAKALRKSNVQLFDQALREMLDNPQRYSQIVERLTNDPQDSATDLETTILAIRGMELQNEYTEALSEVNNAKTDGEKMVATAKLSEIQNKLADLEDISALVGSAQGKALQARKMLIRGDFSLGRLTAELRAAQQGEPLSNEQEEVAREVSNTVERTESELQDIETKKEEEQSRVQAEETLTDLKKEAKVEPLVASILDRLLKRISSAADKARERIRARTYTTFAAIDPTVFYDVAVIGTEKIALGIRDFTNWVKSMKTEFDDNLNTELEDHWKDIFDRSDKMLDEEIDKAPNVKEKVKKIIKNPTVEQVIEHTGKQIKGRIKEGESISELRSYIQKLSLAFVKQGVSTVDGLVDAVHSVIEPIVPGITKRQTMDLISGYGDFHELSKDQASVKLRDLKGQQQQLAKLEDLLKRIALKKTGVQRREVSDTERRLIRQVNELKKKIGVVVTDPAKQLKSAQDSIKTALKNQIKDLTHQIETGEMPVPGTPTPTDQEIDTLRATRDQLNKTLKAIEEKEKTSTFDEQIKAYQQEVKSIEATLNSAIKNYESQLKGEKKTPAQKKFTNDRIEALKRQRELLKTQVDALKAADTDLQNSRAFDRLMKQADELQARLDRGDVQPKTKAEKIEDDLVTEARNNLKNLRDQMLQARRATSQFQQQKIDAAIKAVERSIAAMNAKISSGKVAPDPKTTKVTSPMLDKLRKDRDDLQKLINEMRKGPKLSPDEVALKNYKARLEARTKELNDRVAKGDFSKRTPKRIDLSKDPEAIKLLVENIKAKDRFDEARLKAEKAGWGIAKQTYNLLQETAGAARSSVGSVDISYFLRQSLQATAAAPLRAFRTLFRSFANITEAGFNKHQAEMSARPHATDGVYKDAGLGFSSLTGPLSKREEQFRSNWASKLWHVKFSERAFVSFLNQMRADTFDILYDNAPVTMTKERTRALGRYVNIATGKGELGRLSGAAELLSIPFWSPRLYASRLQAMSAFPIWQSDAKGIRMMIAKEYLKSGMSGLAVTMLAVLAGADIEEDPENSDLGKFRFGKTRIDPWGGHQQWLVFMYRMLTGRYETVKEDKKMKLGSPKGPIDPDYGDVAGRMTRSKFNPVLSAIVNWKMGRDIGGNKVDTKDAILGAVMPLSVFNDDIVPIAKEHGLSAAAAAQLLNMMGVGVQSYDDERKKQERYAR